MHFIAKIRIEDLLIAKMTTTNIFQIDNKHAMYNSMRRKLKTALSVFGKQYFATSDTLVVER